MSTRSQIIQTALEWVDTPYHHHAMVKGVGVDCAMLVAACALASGDLSPEDMPNIINYPVEWHLHNHEELLIQQIQAMGARPIENTSVKAGDILGFKFGRTTSHLGIVVSISDEGQINIVHAARDSGKVVEVTLNGDLLNRWTTTFQFPGADA